MLMVTKDEATRLLLKPNVTIDGRDHAVVPFYNLIFGSEVPVEAMPKDINDAVSSLCKQP